MLVFWFYVIFLVNRFDVLASQGCAANFFEKNHFFVIFSCFCLHILKQSIIFVSEIRNQKRIIN